MTPGIIATIGTLKVLLWAAAAAFGFYRKRSLATIAFTLAALVASARGINDVTDPKGAVVNSASFVALFIPALLLASFMYAQPLGRRPRSWTP